MATTEKSFRDTSLPIEERVELLVSQMTMEEKVYQLCHGAPAIGRLGVPSYNWWNEALHGIARAGVATVFPQAIGMAASFNKELLGEVATVISDEGRAKYHAFQREGDNGIYKGLTYWSPNVNIFRDPRWGRGHETYGEDPYLSGSLGVEFIRKLQDEQPDGRMKSAACAKHFAVHSGPEGVRHEFNAIADKHDLFDTYLPAFEMCVKEGHVESVMGAYNRTNDEACCASPVLLGDILRERWGFEGHVVSDCGALFDLHTRHGLTNNIMESAALALKNGCDLNCGETFLHLTDAYKNGLVTDADLDTALRRVMTARFKLGMFDDTGDNPFADISYETIACDEHLALSRTMAEQCTVLLKNNGILPLDASKLSTVAVVGPNADSRIALLGNYTGTPSTTITPLVGIRDRLAGKARVIYAQGCHLFKDIVEPICEPDERIAEAVSAARQSDVVIACIGLDTSLEGEEGDANNAYASGDKPGLSLPDSQQRLLKALKATGKPIIVVMLCGSALALNWEDENADAILNAWYPGEQGGYAIADILMGNVSPSGRLPLTFYRSDSDLPAFEDYSMAGRTYRYLNCTPLYPFGYGLSYSSFVYDNLASEQTVEAGNGSSVRFTLKNTGGYDAREVVQVYVKAEDPAVPAPHWSLYGYTSLTLEKGAATSVEIPLPPAAFSLVDADGNRVVNAGRYTIYVGGSQPDARSRELLGTSPQSVTVTVTGNVVLDN